MAVNNLFADAAAPTTGERFDTLLSHHNLIVERIVSSGAITPEEYVQDQDEWVALLQGQASLNIDGKDVQLSAGDHFFLPAHTPHTVISASEGAIWLAVHLHPTNKEYK